MDIRKKELYEVFADSLEKSRTKEGGLLFDKLFEDMWEHIEPKLGQSLPIDSVVESFSTLVTTLDNKQHRVLVPIDYDATQTLDYLDGIFGTNKWKSWSGK
jgi:hypothetical protein